MEAPVSKMPPLTAHSNQAQPAITSTRQFPRLWHFPLVVFEKIALESNLYAKQQMGISKNNYYNKFVFSRFDSSNSSPTLGVHRFSVVLWCWILRGRYFNQQACAFLQLGKC